MMTERTAKFGIGQVVKHRIFPFRGVIFDVDPEFSNTEEWYEAIPEHIRPPKNQPFYHLLAESADAYYVAYVSEQNLVSDNSGDPVEHPAGRRGLRRAAGRLLRRPQDRPDPLIAPPLTGAGPGIEPAAPALLEVLRNVARRWRRDRS